MTEPFGAVARPEPRLFRPPALGRPLSVAVIGGGLAGLACADLLGRHRLRVRLFDKGRGLGGRAATRRTERYRFDHGAQYFTARDPVFVERVEEWLARGAAAVWNGRIRALEQGRVLPGGGGEIRYVGVPGMSAVARCLAGAMTCETRIEIGELTRAGKRWRPRAAGHGDLGRYDLAVVAVPPAQAEPLLSASPELAGQAAAVTMLPTWAVMTAFESPLDLPFDGAFVQGSPLSWVARNNSKPGRHGAECWVLHASHEWSREHLEDDAEKVAGELLEAFAEAAGQAPPVPRFRTAHLWRYARPEQPLPGRCLFDDEIGLGACGDWCGGPRVEGAYLSGWNLAMRILARFGDVEELEG